MKNLLNEIKAMNKIAGTELTKEQEIAIIKQALNEAKSKTLNEAKDPYYEIGHEQGPNGSGDNSYKKSAEQKKVKAKAEELYQLVNDKDLINWTKGYVDSMASRQSYDGVETVAEMLLFARKRL